MIKMTRLLMAATTLCGLAYGAQAADLAQPRVLNYPVATDPVAATGWYLRGDIGVGILSSGSWFESSIDNPQSNQSTGWINRKVNDSTNIGAGVGYQFSDNLRGDVTLQYRTSTSFQGGNFITNNNNGATGENAITGSVRSTVALVNGYYDVTHWNGLTPFVGAGIGAAYNMMSATSTQQGGFNPNEYGVYPLKGQTNFAWALHTGLSYDINSRLKLEMGYSFLNLGDTKAGPLTCYGASTPVNCNDLFKIKQLTSSDFHIGMRWLLNDTASASTQTSYQNSSFQTYQSPTYQTPGQTYQSPAYQTSGQPVVAKY